MQLLDAQLILGNLGAFAVVGVALIIFFETATILGSFLPGDSLLFLLGITLATWLDNFPLPFALALVFTAAVMGSEVGFFLGRKFGPRIFDRPAGIFFHQGTVIRTENFFLRFGGKAIILARFVPVLRALVPMFAAISNFERRRFFQLNLIGAAAWVIGLMLTGYFLGQIPLVQSHIEGFVLGFVILSSLPLPYELLREYFSKRRGTKNTGAV